MIKKCKCWIMCLFFLGISVCNGKNVFAAEEKGSILIDYSVENHTKPISGAEFGVLKILDNKGETDEWNLALTVQGMNIEEIKKCTESAARKLAKEMPDLSMKMLTGENGKVYFPDLEEGIWLVYQVKRTGMAARYEMAAPCLISIPSYTDGHLEHHVTIFPKTYETESEGIETSPALDAEENSVEKEHNEKPDIVQTGDDSYLIIWIQISFIAWFVAAIMLIWKRRVG